MWILIARAVRASGAIEQAVLWLLVTFSVVSWALILMKIVILHRARRNNARFLALFNTLETIGDLSLPRDSAPSPLAEIFIAAVDTIGNRGHSRQVPLRGHFHEKVMLRMQHAARDGIKGLRAGSGFLATVGSSSPFIGLFGTVWGIMATFQALGDAKSASLAVVAPSIASALIATAAGLAVAIPAVMAYNWLAGQLTDFQDDADTFIDRMDLMTRAEGANLDAAGSNGDDSDVVLAQLDR